MSDLECPYCEANCGYAYDLEGTEDIEHECDKCGKTFLFDVEYDPVYYERKADCLNGSPHDYKPLNYYDPPRERCSICNQVRLAIAD